MFYCEYLKKINYIKVMEKFILNNIIIFDTEYTAWEGSQERNWSEEDEYKEIVQIAAIKIIDGKIVDEFDILIKPKINSYLSDYFTNLTGISNEDLTNSIDFEDGVNKFRKFCGEFDVYAYGSDYNIILDNFKLYNIQSDEILKWKKNNYDIRDYFEEKNIDTSKFSSGTIYQITNKTYDDFFQHNALWDSKSIFYAIKYLES